MSNTSIFLFSIDLEDIRHRFEDGRQFRPRVPSTTQQYLNFLQLHDMQATFFTVGELAREEPDLVRQILDQGHEIACHSDRHIPLSEQTPKEFAEDIERNLEALQAAGAQQVRGFRAPVFSLTENTAWVYSILKDYGLTYSSSVLPAPNPLHGWPGFGQNAKLMDGILEIPMTVLPFPGFSVPFGGGVYFRALPARLLLFAFNWCTQQGLTVVGYFHPYDVDLEQENFMHPGINNNRTYNLLLRYNRCSVFPKLEKIIRAGWIIKRFDDYIDSSTSSMHQSQAT